MRHPLLNPRSPYLSVAQAAISALSQTPRTSEVPSNGHTVTLLLNLFRCRFPISRNPSQRPEPLFFELNKGARQLVPLFLNFLGLAAPSLP
jgi:hypothetical protein